jgi:hypothetical protein
MLLITVEFIFIKEINKGEEMRSFLFLFFLFPRAIPAIRVAWEKMG